MLAKIRAQVEGEELDYGLLMSHLSSYAKPRDKITRWIRSGDLIRIKKGLYVFGPRYQRRPYSREILANLIYGPSYLSCEYALSFYDMIPERVEEITSMTTQRSKRFETPLGRFSYLHLHPRRYSVGVIDCELGPNRYSLIASPEKALADTLARQLKTNDQEELRLHLVESLRIEEEMLERMNGELLGLIATAYRYPTVTTLAKVCGSL